MDTRACMLHSAALSVALVRQCSHAPVCECACATASRLDAPHARDTRRAAAHTARACMQCNARPARACRYLDAAKAATAANKAAAMAAALAAADAAVEAGKSFVVAQLEVRSRAAVWSCGAAAKLGACCMPWGQQRKSSGAAQLEKPVCVAAVASVVC